MLFLYALVVVIRCWPRAQSRGPQAAGEEADVSVEADHREIDAPPKFGERVRPREQLRSFSRQYHVVCSGPWRHMCRACTLGVARLGVVIREFRGSRLIRGPPF